MKRIKQTIWPYWLLLMLFISLPAMAQHDHFTISGEVRNHDTGKPIAYVNVSVAGEHVSTVTNADGAFTLKTQRKPERIILSHVGYLTRTMPVGGETSNLKITMQPTVVTLSEIVINPGDARELLNAAIEKIPENYSQQPELFRGFYRETTQKGRRYIYVAEAVIDMYKSEYSRTIDYDRVAIDRARRLISTKSSDTLGAKVQGGPNLPIHIDVVKNLSYLFSPDEMMHYDYKMEDPLFIDNRLQLVISMTPKHIMPYPLYFGKIYIDNSTLAFSRVELDLDMSDHDKAGRMMLIKKPWGVKFRPREMKILVNYVLQAGVSRISYVQSTSRFTCDWKRKLFKSNYQVTSEMVVTDRYPEAKTIAGRATFRNYESLYDKVELFEDPGFWGKDNIIEPTESLEKAIDKLKRSLKKK